MKFRIRRKGGKWRVVDGGKKLLAILKRHPKETITVIPLPPLSYPAVNAIRAKMVEWMDWAIRHEPQIHYKQSRPLPLEQMKQKRLPLYTDCSGSTIGCHYYAGAKDPSGDYASGPDYTGSIRTTCPQIALGDAKPGDMIIYGPGTGKHMVMVRHPHPSDPVVWSHGQEAGPILISHSAQVRYQGSYFTVHRARI